MVCPVPRSSNQVPRKMPATHMPQAEAVWRKFALGVWGTASEVNPSAQQRQLQAVVQYHIRSEGLWGSSLWSPDMQQGGVHEGRGWLVRRQRRHNLPFVAMSRLTTSPDVFRAALLYSCVGDQCSRRHFAVSQERGRRGELLQSTDEREVGYPGAWNVSYIHCQYTTRLCVR